jgi:bifunctional polynucleotide phosphatase/kinase
MDDTLIKVKSGAKFPKDANDWLFWDKSVPDKLRELDKDGFKLVIFTNQNGISLGKTSASDIQTKIQNICKEVGVQMTVFIASADDEYRKPSTRMWEILESKHNGGVKIDKKKSFFCGDAAGRKTARHKDFSDTDLKFAVNCDVPFKTPEVLFLNEKEETIEIKGFNPKTVATDGELVEG